MSFRPQGEIFAFNSYSTLNLEDFSSFLVEMTALAAYLAKTGKPCWKSSALALPARMIYTDLCKLVSPNNAQEPGADDCAGHPSRSSQATD
jgi:hypothetical protein